jgi:DNA-binding beta-propeller fold protein YncE
MAEKRADLMAGGKRTRGVRWPAVAAVTLGWIGALASAGGASAFVYVVNQGAATVSQFSGGPFGALTPLSPPAIATMGNTPTEIALSPDGEHAYVSELSGGTVYQYEVATGGTLTPMSAPTVATGAVPLGVAVSPDGHSVYVVNDEGGAISQYNAGPGGELTPKPTPTVADTGGDPYYIAVSPNGRSVYVTNYTGDDVSQYRAGPDGALHAMSVPTAAAGVYPVDIALSPDGRNAYVTNLGSGTVSQYAVATGGELLPRGVPTLAAGFHPAGVAIARLQTALATQPLKLGVTLKPSATLTVSATGAPVAGVKVSFMLGKGVLCSSMTDAAGTATCVKHGAALILSPPPRYHAVFAGNADYAPSHVRGKLREPCPGIGICIRKLK